MIWWPEYCDLLQLISIKADMSIRPLCVTDNLKSVTENGCLIRFYQYTEEHGEKSSDEVGTALFNWIYDAKVVKKRRFEELHIYFDNAAGELILLVNHG